MNKIKNPFFQFRAFDPARSLAVLAYLRNNPDMPHLTMDDCRALFPAFSVKDAQGDYAVKDGYVQQVLIDALELLADGPAEDRAIAATRPVLARVLDYIA